MKIFDLFDNSSNEKNTEPRHYRHSDMQHSLLRKLKRQPNITARCDLHGLTQSEAAERLTSFFHDHPNTCMIEVIHGCGMGVLRKFTRHWLTSNKRVVAYWPSQEGNDGSLTCYIIARR